MALWQEDGQNDSNPLKFVKTSFYTKSFFNVRRYPTCASKGGTLSHLQSTELHMDLLKQQLILIFKDAVMRFFFCFIEHTSKLGCQVHTKSYIFWRTLSYQLCMFFNTITLAFILPDFYAINTLFIFVQYVSIMPFPILSFAIFLACQFYLYVLKTTHTCT